MTELAKLYYSFWMKFTGTAFDRVVGPRNADMPYISYESIDNDIFNTSLQSVIVWVRSEKSLAPLNAICDEIREAIPHEGAKLFLPDGKGAIVLRRGAPFMQPYAQDEDSVKAAYINVEVKSYIF